MMKSIIISAVLAATSLSNAFATDSDSNPFTEMPQEIFGELANYLPLRSTCAIACTNFDLSILFEDDIFARKTLYNEVDQIFRDNFDVQEEARLASEAFLADNFPTIEDFVEYGATYHIADLTFESTLRDLTKDACITVLRHIKEGLVGNDSLLGYFRILKNTSRFITESFYDDRVRLNLSNVDIHFVPSNIDQFADRITTLDFSHNNIWRLPSAIYRLPNLTRLYLQTNGYNVVPPLSDEIEHLTNLQDLSYTGGERLENHKFTALPAALVHGCPELSHITTSSNYVPYYFDSNRQGLLIQEFLGDNVIVNVRSALAVHHGIEFDEGAIASSSDE